ncbi:uncharacterized protein LOC125238052 [Leguminivora glycinivorella]|uniref:uncharacterized protein LOC125238052 n=1 Tax=Leguminivora glycinivorella TaxID=1035111 RepID=UPI00200D8A70|nr:uncharacterized protein LOC125238052 [Leguminivora glycinivorella]
MVVEIFGGGICLTVSSAYNDDDDDGYWSWLALGCSYAHAIHLTAQMCVPAVCAELVLARADALSTLIHNRLLVEQDDTTRSNLTRLVRYVRARPPLRKAWRLLPPGLKLPLAMLSMCTTALIVVIQSTHLYD